MYYVNFTTIEQPTSLSGYTSVMIRVRGEETTR